VKTLADPLLDSRGSVSGFKRLSDLQNRDREEADRASHDGPLESVIDNNGFKEDNPIQSS
jgi:hypothetical protein